jgi:hypothetical protein
MQLQPEELESKGYVQLESLNHQELIPFVQTYIKKRTKAVIFFITMNFILFGWIVLWFFKSSEIDGFKFINGFNYISIGMAIAFALIPFHEFIHVLAYKSQGAKNTSYDVNWKKLYFMALADKFVANAREFRIVALAPFVTITVLGFILLAFVGTSWTFTILGTLFVHTACCAGDFALLSYFEYNKDKEVVTYDDISTGISYFYGKMSK